MLSCGRQGLQRARFASRNPYLNSDSAWEQGGRDAISAAFAVRERAHICYLVSRQLGPYRATLLESKSPSRCPPPRRGLALARELGSRVPLARGPWIGERLLDDPASKGRPVPIRLYFGPLLFLDQFSDPLTWVWRRLPPSWAAPATAPELSPLIRARRTTVKKEVAALVPGRRAP
jgi:hypothetical protein